MARSGIRRDHLLTMRITTGERKAIERLAKLMGASVSETLRTLVNQRLQQIEKP